MAKQLDKDMLRMMTITERFNYIAAKKRMEMSIDKNQNTNQEDWVDRDDDGGYDSSSDGKRNSGDNSYDDSNEY
tara:strand:+ start:250 stop:471 length:222 start_codon:yes stop_codon:yes gene_type:complete